MAAGCAIHIFKILITVTEQRTAHHFWVPDKSNPVGSAMMNIAGFVRHFITYVKKIDTVNAVTVGHWLSKFCANTSDLVDVISFHDYLETRSRVEKSYAIAEGYSKKYIKPLINSELCCIGRSNPYDMAIQIADEHNLGWYVFNLIISGYWGEIHGLIYPDGTIRDPSSIAAIYGFYRKRDLNTTVKALPYREEHAEKAIALLEKVIDGDFDVFPDVFDLLVVYGSFYWIN